MCDSDPVRMGVELLARVDDRELSLADAVDRIEAVTNDPRLTREILDRAEERGIIAREDGRVRLAETAPLRFDREVTRREGEFTCRRCGTGIGTGWFLDLEAGELGPYGSTCIRIVTGRE